MIGGVGAAALFSAKDLKAQASEALTCVDGLSESLKAQDFNAASENAQQIANLSGDMADNSPRPCGLPCPSSPWSARTSPRRVR